MKPKLVGASVCWRDGARIASLTVEVEMADVEGVLDGCHLDDGPDVEHMRELGQAAAKQRAEESAASSAPEHHEHEHAEHAEPEPLPEPPHVGEHEHEHEHD